MREPEDKATYYLVIARETDMDGVPRCINCGKAASAVHEILPKSFFGPKKRSELFAMKNRCCLCNVCHPKLHNPIGRGKLFFLMWQGYGYEYEGLSKCLLEDYLAVK